MEPGIGSDPTTQNSTFELSSLRGRVDGSFSKAKGGGDGIGCTKAGKGVKIMIAVDAQGLPIAVSTHSASPVIAWLRFTR
jgi:hypothetical protein